MTTTLITLGSWMLVLMVPGTATILQSVHKTEIDCIKEGYRLEFVVQDKSKPLAAPGSTFECVQTY